MKHTIRHHLYKLIPALLLLVCCGVFLTSVPKSSAILAESEFILLWEDSLSSEEASAYLSQLSPEKREITMTAVSVKPRAFSYKKSGSSGSGIMPGSFPNVYWSRT